MNNIDLNKLKDLAIKAAAGSLPVPVAYEQPRIYSDAEISYLAFAAAVTPAAFLAIVNDLQAEVAAKQQNVDYLADRVPEVQKNGMMLLSQQLADALELQRGTQEKLGKALERNSAQAAQLEATLRDRDAAIAGHRGLAATLITDRGALLERAEAAEADLARRDAAAGEPVAWQFFDNGQWYTGSDRNNHRKSTESAGYRVRNLYTAAQPAALPPEMMMSDAVKANVSTDFMDGANWMREQAKVLGCQPVPVVKLPQPLMPARHDSGELFMTPDNVEFGGYLNRDDVERCLLKAGVRCDGRDK